MVEHIIVNVLVYEHERKELFIDVDHVTPLNILCYIALDCLLKANNNTIVGRKTGCS